MNAKKIKEIDYNSIITDKSNKVIVALHGWQGNKDSFLPLVKNPLFNQYNWFLLQGPYMVNNDPNRRTWSYEVEPDVFEYKEPKRLLDNFFESNIFNHYKSKDVFVIGFSLGALVCYEFICKMKEPLGGIFPVSGFSRENIVLHKNQIKTPILIGHGLQDEIVVPEKSIEAYNILKNQKANVELSTYRGGHRMSIDIINSISNIIKNS